MTFGDGHKKQTIGLYGGAFDPVHVQHVAIMRESLLSGLVDELYVLPDKSPRRKHAATDYQHRLAMLKIATNKLDAVHVETLDMQREGRTYGPKELLELIGLFRGSRLKLILGEDAAAYFDQWPDVELFCSHLEFIIAKRPGCSERFEQMVETIRRKGYAFRFEYLNIVPKDVSSSLLRHHLKQKLGRPDLLDAQVYDYLCAKEL